jgi:hypothetical protein
MEKFPEGITARDGICEVMPVNYRAYFQVQHNADKFNNLVIK